VGRQGATVLTALRRLNREIAINAPKKHNANLTSFQVVMYRDFADKVRPMLAPLVSGFGKFDKQADVAFVHK
jgi:hypothetical protein